MYDMNMKFKYYAYIDISHQILTELVGIFNKFEISLAIDICQFLENIAK